MKPAAPPPVASAPAPARPRTRRARLPAEQRIADIMAAAAGVFREKGYEQASTAEIAERAGVVEGTLYRYFETKRDLFVRVVEAFYQQAFADYDRQLRGVRGAWNRLRFLVWKHLALLHAEPRLCRLVTEELRAWPEYTRTSVYQLNRQYTDHVMRVVREGIAAGEIRADVPPRLVRDLVFGACEHHAWGYLRGEGRFDPAAAADAITDIVFRGLAAQPPAAARQDTRAVERLERLADRLEGLTRGTRPRGARRAADRARGSG
jgi:TetR/AcrR family transcriptional regulator, fatty acid metabolism regulator protein